MTNILIVFLKYPEPGMVKTRLAREIGNERACIIYKLLAERVIKNISWRKAMTYTVHIFFSPADKESEIKDWLKSILDSNGVGDIQYRPQEGNNLGERMFNAFKQTLPANAIIIGTDCPGIDATLIENTFEVLKEKDVVIGPCKDGGYYLLGMSGHVPACSEKELIFDLFADIDWSTDKVFGQTMKKIQKNKLSFRILQTLIDIDTKKDFECISESLAIVKFLSIQFLIVATLLYGSCAEFL